MDNDAERVQYSLCMINDLKQAAETNECINDGRKKNEYFKKLKQCQYCVRYVWHRCLVKKSRAHKQHSISHIATGEQFSSRNAHAKKEEKRRNAFTVN